MAAFVSATYPRETVHSIPSQPDFPVVFGGYAGRAVRRPRCKEGPKRSLGVIFSERVDCAVLVKCCKAMDIKAFFPGFFHFEASRVRSDGTGIGTRQISQTHLGA